MPSRAALLGLAAFSASAVAFSPSAATVRPTSALRRPSSRALLRTSAIAEDADEEGPTTKSRLIGVSAALAAGGAAATVSTPAAGVFAGGLACVALEELIGIDKAAIAILMATGTWSSLGGGAGDALSLAVASAAEVCAFVVGASAIVEVVDAHGGFGPAARVLEKFQEDKSKLLYATSFISFFLSSVLNNLTVTVLMVSVLKKLGLPTNQRRILAAAIVIAANAGGAWTPIGDVTTTMLWMDDHLTTVPLLRDLVLPSLACSGISAFFLNGPLLEAAAEEEAAPAAPAQARGGWGGGKKTAAPVAEPPPPAGADLVTGVGITSLLSVPIISDVLSVPPAIGMLAACALTWFVTDTLHGVGGTDPDPDAPGQDKSRLSMPAALNRVDGAGILFFFGALTAVGSLESTGVLAELARTADTLSGGEPLGIATAIGLASAVVDNVPLVAATQGMYGDTLAPDAELWQLIAYCAGTGGSILSIGSAAGVALMAIERGVVTTTWWLKAVAPSAAAGFFGGIAVYVAPPRRRRSGSAAANFPAC